MPFQLKSPFQAAGDQPKAIQTLSDGIRQGENHQILLGVTGSGKTFTIANVIQQTQKPTLIIAHNKTLAAQLYSEFKEFFPDNAVEFFISYYDYYQPEAYIASRDTYIEKEADINKEIERLRHRATRSLVSRKDVIIIASVSCIYGLGIPEDYIKSIITVTINDNINRKNFLLQLEKAQYERNDYELQSGRYRIKGDCIDLYPSWDEYIYRLEFFGDLCESIKKCDPITFTVSEELSTLDIFPATHYVLSDDKSHLFKAIKDEMLDRVSELTAENKIVEAQRIQQRTLYDLDMLQEIGYCKGIENYSRHLSARKAGEAPGVLLDFFRDDFLVIIDESHATIPQIKGMYKGDQSRKQALVDYGFRLPSAKDNRPLCFEEFVDKTKQCIYVSATPGDYELELCKKSDLENTPDNQVENKWKNYRVVEQIIRPTGLLDPKISLHSSEGQIDKVLEEVKKRVAKQERVLITTLTKQMSEDLCDFLLVQTIKVQYLHSDISALDRVDILNDLRKGKYDVIVGVNLLREGLDLPEVSLVIILDADKEGFLRNERSLIQTIGRAARHENGEVLLLADRVSAAMQGAIDETNRRREIQKKHNIAHNISPKTIIKKISEIREDTKTLIGSLDEKKLQSPKDELKTILELEKEMRRAADNLEFEVAAVIRDTLEKLKNKN
jgi:excinuclease ABC subunit B